MSSVNTSGMARIFNCVKNNKNEVVSNMRILIVTCSQYNSYMDSDHKLTKSDQSFKNVAIQETATTIVNSRNTNEEALHTFNREIVQQQSTAK